MTDWRSAQKKAALVGKWAVTMTKVRIRKTISKTRWQLVTFIGPKGGESVGIIDLMAIRKNHTRGKTGLKRGDLFEIVLIQVKGGASRFPSPEEVERLRIVGSVYKAKAILLAQWKRGSQISFYHMQPSTRMGGASWQPLASPSEIFH